MATKNRKEFRRKRIRHRIRRIVSGTAERPRLSVFRSNEQIYAQLIDDVAGKTLAAASSHVYSISSQQINKTEKAKCVGKVLAECALEKGITAVVFDRSGYLYHGRVKSLADAARESGLKF